MFSTLRDSITNYPILMSFYFSVKCGFVKLSCSIRLLSTIYFAIHCLFWVLMCAFCINVITVKHEFDIFLRHDPMIFSFA